MHITFHAPMDWLTDESLVPFKPDLFFNKCDYFARRLLHCSRTSQLALLRLLCLRQLQKVQIRVLQGPPLPDCTVEIKKTTVQADPFGCGRFRWINTPFTRSPHWRASSFPRTSRLPFKTSLFLFCGETATPNEEASYSKCLVIGAWSPVMTGLAFSLRCDGSFYHGILVHSTVEQSNAIYDPLFLVSLHFERRHENQTGCVQ